MKLETRIKVGKKRVIVIPKKIAKEVGIREGMHVKIGVSEGSVIIKPIIDAVELSLRARKIARITLEELEEESLEIQKKFIE